MTPNNLKVEFFIGTTLDRDGGLLPESVRDDAEQRARRDLLTAFGGFSKQVITGAWRSPVTCQVSEDVTFVFSCIAPLDTPAVLVDLLKKDFAAYFRQECVVLVVTPCYASF